MIFTPLTGVKHSICPQTVSYGLHLVTSDAELQSNGVNDGGTTESRGLHG